MKTYVGISRDHSGSMRGVADVAMQDYNTLVADLKTEAIKSGIDTVLSVVECGIKDPSSGYRTVNRFAVVNSSIAAVKKLNHYETSGQNTPLLDSVVMLINQMKAVPDYDNPDVSFLLMIVTDGGDNASKTSNTEFARLMQELNRTDNWTVTFRVPNGYRQRVIDLGVPAGNVMEFDASDCVEYAKTTVASTQAVSNYYTARSVGLKKSERFFVDADKLNTTEVKRELSNISKKVKIVRVTQADDGKRIDEFVEQKTGQYILGTCHYQLTKKEDLQDHKRIIVWNKDNGEYYTGAEARSLLGLSTTGTVKIAPGNHSQFEIFVQSSSVNRKLVGGTKIVIYQG